MIRIKNAEENKPDEVKTVEFTKEDYQKLLEVNDVEKLIEKYGSYSITWDEYGGYYYLYQAKDFLWYDYRDDLLEYETKDYSYMLRGTDPSDFSLMCKVFLYDHTIDYYRFMFVDTYEEYTSGENETVVSVYLEDGYVHYKTVYNEEAAKAVVFDYLGEEKPGWTVYSELIYNAETYEATHNINYMEKDGERVVLSDMFAGFGETVPSGVYALRASFERQSRNMMTVNYVADLGTDHEIRKTVTVPQNCECAPSVGSVAAVYFTNPEYTAVDRWDRKSDITYYVVTNPSDELVNRYNEIIASD